MKEFVKNDGFVSEAELCQFVHEAFADQPVDHKRILFVVPDATRSMPMPTMFRALHKTVADRVAKVDFMIALGTHPPMTDEAINRWFGVSPEERRTRYAAVDIFNHQWDDPNALVKIGTLEENEVSRISSGMLCESVDVTINRRIFDYDILCVVGPVFPHEVVGFSGGNKYFFPGIAGQEIIDFFHWLGALITIPVIIGTAYTPVRAVVDRAAALIDREKLCFCLNVTGRDCRGLFFGSPEEAWDGAAKMAARTHIVYKDKPFDRALAIAPDMYDEMWVAGKCMYKLEPVLADGAELVILAPHIRELSVTHGAHIRRVGYHTRDYFLAQLDKFADVPRGILAHSTHVRGIGAYDNGIEKPRVNVVLATGIPEEDCRAINLGFRHPESVNADEYRDREHEGHLFVPHAGEVLYRLREGGPAPRPYRPHNQAG